MAQWLARGIAVVGFVALGWTSHGFGQPPAAAPPPPVQAQQAAAADRRRRRCLDRRERAGVSSRRWPGSRCASKPTPASSPSGRPLRGARHRLRRRLDHDRRDAQPDLARRDHRGGDDGGRPRRTARRRPSRRRTRAAARRRQPLHRGRSEPLAGPASRSSRGCARPASTTASTSSSTATRSASSTTSWSRRAPIRRRSGCASTAPTASRSTPAGDLLVHAGDGEPLRQQAPISYQVIDGVRRDGREPLRAARRARGRHRRRRLRSPPAADHRSGADLLVVLRRHRGRAGLRHRARSLRQHLPDRQDPRRRHAAGDARRLPGDAARPQRRVRRQVQSHRHGADLLHVPRRHGHRHDAILPPRARSRRMPRATPTSSATRARRTSRPAAPAPTPSTAAASPTRATRST